MPWLWEHVTPDWVQAVGSILAIVVGFAAIVWQRGHEERSKRADQAREARALGAYLVPLLSDFALELTSVRRRLEGQVSNIWIKSPPTLDASIDRLYRLGPPGDRVLRVLGEITQTEIEARREITACTRKAWHDTYVRRLQLLESELKPRWHAEISTAIKEIQSSAKGRTDGPAR